jgi:D-3-phosphoglycerate dehydrogenase
MKLLVTTFIREEDLEKLKKYFNEIHIRGLSQISRVLEPEELIQEMHDIDVFIVEFEQITEKILAKSKHLKLIASVRAGPQANIDIAAATRRGIPVLYSPGRSSDVVADFTIGLLLAATRYIAKGHFLVKTHQLTEVNPRRPGFARRDIVWITNDPENFPYLKLKGIGLRGKTLGILGLGAIGKEVARRAITFKMKVIAHDPYVLKEDAERIGVQLVDKDTLFREADFVSVHVKIEPKTATLVGKKELELMKPTAFFINTARAFIVDQKALYRVLKEKHIAGAALDVFENEPLRPDDPFLDLDNVVLTPHIAGACYDNYEKASSIVTRGIEDYLKGARPQHVINSDALIKTKIPNRKLRLKKQK